MLHFFSPVFAETEQGIFDAVLRGTIDFTSDPWPRISPSAKDLVKRMLRQDPKERLTAHQVLSETTQSPNVSVPYLCALEQTFATAT